MNKSMLTGVIAGVAIATAGGVAGYAFFGQPSATDNADSAAVAEDVPAEAPGMAATQRPSPDPRPAAPAPQTTAAQPTAASAAQVLEECWDEEVTTQAAPRDQHAIAGTAAGAVIGGAIAKEVGDDNDLLTAAGAAAGAFFGRKAQRRFQENNATTTVERRCAPAGAN